MIKNCPVCNKNNFKKIFSNNKIPKYELTYYLNKKASLNHEFVKINFVLCKNCGFLFNNIYHQLNYKDNSYDANRSNSDYFINYLKNICNDLLKKIADDKKNIKNIVEIGAGDGNFSKLISSKLNCKVFAFDPSWSKKSKSKNLYKINDYYTPKYKFNPDIVIFRHVLEHVSNVKKFIRNAINENPKYVFIEIPVADFVLKNNFHYFENEHCSYFNNYSLELLMNNFGYYKVYIRKEFNNEYIVSLWRKKNNLKIKNKKINIKKLKLMEYKKWKLKILNNLKPKSIIWGAGGKGVMIFNMLNLNYKKFEYVIDINHKLHGKYMPGTGNMIISPLKINELDIKNIYFLNVLYKKEIKKFLNKISYKGKLRSLFIK